MRMINIRIFIKSIHFNNKMNGLIRVTARAVPHLQRISNKSIDDGGVFLSLASGGCNGFTYNIEPTREKIDKKVERCQIDDLTVYICNKSLMFLIGCEIDWHEDDMGSRFIFNNPLAKNKCGCNKSFSV